MDKILNTKDLSSLPYDLIAEAVRNGYDLKEMGKPGSLIEFIKSGGIENNSSINEMNNVRTLDVKLLGTIPIENLITLYKQGFKLDTINPEISKLNPATCPQTIYRGNTKQFSLTVTTESTPPYTYKIYRNDSVIDSYGPTMDTSHIFKYVVNDTDGTYTFGSDVTDSCPTGALTSIRDSCQITVISMPPTIPPTTIPPTTIPPTTIPPTTLPPTGCAHDSVNIFGKCINKRIIEGAGVITVGLLGYEAYKASKK